MVRFRQTAEKHQTRFIKGKQKKCDKNRPLFRNQKSIHDVRTLFTLFWCTWMCKVWIKCAKSINNESLEKCLKNTYLQKKRYSSEEQLNISKHHSSEHTYTSYNSQCDFHANQWNRKHLVIVQQNLCHLQICCHLKNSFRTI